MNEKLFLAELKYKAVRSSGKGGQNVNKVSSRVEVSWDAQASLACTDEEKKQIQKILSNRISAQGLLKTESQEDRSQLANKKIATGKIVRMVSNALIKQKKRIPTRVSAAKRQERLNRKKKDSEIKSLRRKPLADF